MPCRHLLSKYVSVADIAVSATVVAISCDSCSCELWEQHSCAEQFVPSCKRYRSLDPIIALQAGLVDFPKRAQAESNAEVGFLTPSSTE